MLLLTAGREQSALAGYRVPTPSWIDLVVIGDKVIRNGLPATIYAFSTARSPEEVFQYYRDIWRNRGGAVNGVREVYVSPWRILSHVENRLLYTLQIRDDDRPGAIGYLAVSEPDNVRVVRRGDVPVLEGSRVGDSLQFMDNGRKSRVYQAENGYAIEQNIDFYRHYYTTRGWTGTRDTAGPARGVLSFTRHEEEVDIVISRIDGKTHIVINNSSRE